MTLNFYKYQGTGNDFVMIDNREAVFDKNNLELVAKLCDRRFGIGADGLILLEEHLDVDFEMIYFNADGSKSLCGNGGRCAVAFAQYLGMIKDETIFMAIDGIHKGTINNDQIALHMQDVSSIKKYEGHLFLDTGSPHHIQFKEDLNNFDIKAEGAKIRYGEPYGEVGSNVNFVNKIEDNIFAVRTYERGVEDETLSCGTGVTAVGIAMHYLGETDNNEVLLQAVGGDLKVSFDRVGDTYTNIWLKGPAKQVFKGSI